MGRLRHFFSFVYYVKFKDFNWLRTVNQRSFNSATEAVEGAALALEGVHDVHGGDGLAASALSVDGGFTDDVLKEHLEDRAGLLVDEAGDTLHTTTASETADSGLGDALDVVTKDLPVTLSAALAKTPLTETRAFVSLTINRLELRVYHATDALTTNSPGPIVVRGGERDIAILVPTIVVQFGVVDVIRFAGTHLKEDEFTPPCFTYTYIILTSCTDVFMGIPLIILLQTILHQMLLVPPRRVDKRNTQHNLHKLFARVGKPSRRNISRSPMPMLSYSSSMNQCAREFHPLSTLLLLHTRRPPGDKPREKSLVYSERSQDCDAEY